jgi:hypothetical protein
VRFFLHVSVLSFLVGLTIQSEASVEQLPARLHVDELWPVTALEFYTQMSTQSNRWASSSLVFLPPSQEQSVQSLPGYFNILPLVLTGQSPFTIFHQHYWRCLGVRVVY